MLNINKKTVQNNLIELAIVLAICFFAYVQSTKHELITFSNATLTAWSHLETSLLNDFELAIHLQPETKQLKEQFKTADSLAKKIAIATQLETKLDQLLKQNHSPEIQKVSSQFLQKTHLEIQTFNHNADKFNDALSNPKTQWITKKQQFSPIPKFPTK